MGDYNSNYQSESKRSQCEECKSRLYHNKRECMNIVKTKLTSIAMNHLYQSIDNGNNLVNFMAYIETLKLRKTVEDELMMGADKDDDILEE
jgi:hypothetical protein